MREHWLGVMDRREIAAIFMTIIIGGVVTCYGIAAAFRSLKNVREAAIALETHNKLAN